MATGIYAPRSGAQGLKAVEYFFDADPGIGNGTRINFPAPVTDIDTVLDIDMSALSLGLHRLFVRSLDTNSHWGLYHIYPVINAQSNQPTVLQKMEYYFDKDPGQGNGIGINLPAAASIDTTVNIDLTSITAGLHQVFFRAMDNAGKWSLYKTYPVIKGPGYGLPLTVNQMEYFIDIDPGVGKASPVAAGQHFLIDTSLLLAIPKTKKDSVTVFVRAMDNRGLWGLYHDTTVGVNCNLYPLKASLAFTPLACGNTLISFQDTTVTSQWIWGFASGDSATGQQVTHPFKQPGSFNISHYIIDEDGCISDTVHQLIIVQPPVVVDAGPDKEINLGDAVTITPVIKGSDSSYLWTPNLYLDNNSIKNPTATATNDITYTIVVTGKGGCTASDSVTVKVNKTPQLVKIPNAFSPNGDGINDTWIIKYLDTYADSRVQVYNRYGQLIFESIGYQRPWDGKYNNKPLPFGTYYYMITTGKGKKMLTGSVSIIY